MSRSVLASLMITRAQRRAGLESAASAFPAAELLDELNESTAAWYRLMAEVRGHDYFAKAATLSLVSGTATYALATDVLQILLVELAVQSGIYQTLHPFTLEERAVLRTSNAYTIGDGSDMRWRILGQTTPVTVTGGTVATDYVEFSPTPAAALTVSYRYLPTPPVFTAATSTLEGIAGYEEYIVCDLASKMATKDGDYGLAGLLDGKRAEAERSIRALAPRRDASSPATWTDRRMSRGSARYRR